MTDVKITKKDGSIVGVVCDGHTGYGVEGEDIVCAALSSIVQTALLGLLTVVGVNVRYKVEGIWKFLSNKSCRGTSATIATLFSTLCCAE